MTPEHLSTLRDLAKHRARFASDRETAPIHRQLVMAGYASCRVEFTGQYINITEKGRAQLQMSAQAENRAGVR